VKLEQLGMETFGEWNLGGRVAIGLIARLSLAKGDTNSGSSDQAAEMVYRVIDDLNCVRIRGIATPTGEVPTRPC
jgi:hypothetical protein